MGTHGSHLKSWCGCVAQTAHAKTNTFRAMQGVESQTVCQRPLTHGGSLVSILGHWAGFGEQLHPNIAGPAARNSLPRVLDEFHRHRHSTFSRPLEHLQSCGCHGCVLALWRTRLPSHNRHHGLLQSDHERRERRERPCMLNHTPADWISWGDERLLLEQIPPDVLPWFVPHCCWSTSDAPCITTCLHL